MKYLPPKKVLWVLCVVGKVVDANIDVWVVVIGVLPNIEERVVGLLWVVGTVAGANIDV